MDQVGGARLRETCNETLTCIGKFVICHIQTSNSYCRCTEGYAPDPTDPHSCTPLVKQNMELGTDPTMIGVIVGLALMSVTICVVMRLFAKARFAENRTIFNTANPRLMNVSLKTGRTPAPGGSDGGKTGIPAAHFAVERKKFTVQDQQQPKDDPAPDVEEQSTNLA